MTNNWHDKQTDEILLTLATNSACGLSPQEAAERLIKIGPNELRKGETASPLTLLAGQFRSLVIWVLIGAALVSMVLGEFVDSIAILAIVLLNALIGFFQEYRAEQAVAALARLTAPRAKVVRGGQTVVIAASEVVPGDILFLEAGDLVAADARLIEASVLRSNEAPLTGESQPVEKRVGVGAPETPLADRKNMVFLGTSIVSGSGRAVVVTTGMHTEVGHIAELLQTATSGQTPLQKRLDLVARRLLWACLGVVVLVFALGLLRGVALFELFLGAVSLAVAAIPEGLPAVVTVALALGMQRMARRNALVRRLPAVETLGCAQVICSDKTGTLTVGEMTARRLVTRNRIFTVSGEGYATQGEFLADGVTRTVAADSLLLALLRAAAACNEAELTQQDHRPMIIGDPTEGALLVVAAKGGVTRASIESEMPRLYTLPFDSDRKRMTVIRSWEKQLWAFIKGAPEVILERCTQIRTESGVERLTDEDRALLLQTGASMAHEALRVLALAERPVETFALPRDGDATISAEDIERDLTLLGLIGLQDPPRAEAKEAIQRCHRAGVRTVMITGDHPDTARAIARELGMLDDGGEVVAGMALEDMSDNVLSQRVHEIAVYARVTAEHKLRIVRAWKSRGAVVAMTGDGVNDAPALKEASIGIAMGITGTEVTKEAADLIVTDDNFASILAAVEEGRGIYDNIAKTLAYLLAGNAGELAVMFIAALVGWPLPLLPIHLLWINLITDGLPALALATDPIDADVLNRPPRSQDAQLLDWAFLKRIILTGILTATVTLVAFVSELYTGGSVEQARSAAFFTLVVTHLLLPFGVCNPVRTSWQVGFFSNLRLLVIVLASLVLQLLIHTLPMLGTLFDTEPISFTQGMAWFLLGTIPVSVLELGKIRRQLQPGSLQTRTEQSVS